MSKFVVITFPDEKKAYEGVRSLKELHAEGSLTLYSSSVVQRDSHGMLSVKDKDSEGPIGIGVGALVGGLIGLFAGPVGVAVGIGGGTALGALRDLFNLGVSDDFVDSVTRELAPGKTAIVAEVSEEWVTPLDTRMEALGGTLVRQVRDDFIDEQLQKRITENKVEWTQRKEERASAKAEEMQAKLKKDVSKAEEKLKATADKAWHRIEDYRQQADAKIHALEEQANRTNADTRERIKQRIAEMRTEEKQRLGKLEQAYKIAQEALTL